MPIVDHYITDPEVDTLVRDMLRAIGARAASDVSARSAGLLSQREILAHHFERLEPESKERAVRTIKWIDTQVARLPKTVYANQYLME